MNPDRFRGLSWNLKEQLFNDKTKFLQFFDVKESVVYFFFFLSKAPVNRNGGRISVFMFMIMLDALLCSLS